LYAKLGSNVLINDKDARAEEDARVKSEIDIQWKDPVVGLMITRVAFPICLAETHFQLCLCKHEMAERAQVRADHAVDNSPELNTQALMAWREARIAWLTYNDFLESQSRIPGRLDQARELMARAEKFASQPPKK
jgi:hypothetical protein